MAGSKVLHRFRLRRVWVGGLALVASMLILACGGGDDQTSIVIGDSGPIIDGEAWPYRGSAMSREIDVPEMTLTTTDGRPFDLRAETEGFATLLYVGYTNCPDFCPTHMAMIARALDALPADTREEVRVIFITSDPERDTAAVLREWLDLFDSSFIGLRGSAGELVEVQRALGMNPAEIEPHEDGHDEYAVNHASFVLAFPPDGRTALIAYPPGATARDFMADLARLTGATP